MLKKKDYPTITVGHLREELKIYPNDYKIHFSGLEFYRVKPRGEKLLQIEFNQTVDFDEQGAVVVLTR